MILPSMGTFGVGGGVGAIMEIIIKEETEPAVC